MSLVEGLTIAALITGPVAAVGISVALQAWVTSRWEKRQEKLYVLRILMSTRHSFITDIHKHTI